MSPSSKSAAVYNSKIMDITQDTNCNNYKNMC